MIGTNTANKNKRTISWGVRKIKIFENGCTCEHCAKVSKQTFDAAKEKWDSGEREIIFKPYHHSCGDGCCDTYGTIVYVNGFDLNCDGESAEDVISNLMEFLNIENVVINHEYENE